LKSKPSPVHAVSGLEAMNINPAEAAAAYREKLIEPHRGVLPDAVLRGMEEQLSGACTMEIAAFECIYGFTPAIKEGILRLTKPKAK